MPFDAARADRVVRFFEEYLVHTKGEWAGRPFELYPWQRDDIIRPLLGTVNDDGSRRYREAFVEIPRKNGKSELAAGVALYLLFADSEPGAEIYGAAADRDQASIVFNVARDMVLRNPKLRARAKVIDSSKRIIVPRTGSFYRAIPADAAGSHGFNAHAVILDEVHTQPNRELYDVLTTSMGARRQPLIFSITTAGNDRNSLCYELHDYALKIMSGVVDDPTFFPYVMAAPEGADWRDEVVWHACNPALGAFRKIDDMRKLAREAESIPARENAFRNLYLNQWTAQAVRWLPLHKWDDCAAPVDPAALRGRPCYAGLDLASTTDIAAFLLVFPPQDEDEPFQVLARFWIPEENLRERVRRDRVPYAEWVRQGLITATSGDEISYDDILIGVDEWAQAYDIRDLGYDRWGATMLIQKLTAAGLNVRPVGQGFTSMSPSTKELLSTVIGRRLAHGGNPVLRWMADNLVVEQDAAGNIKPSKRKSTEKIDGMVALIMALDGATRQENATSVYESRGIVTL